MLAALSYESPLSERVGALMMDLNTFVTSIQRPKVRDLSWAEKAHRLAEDLSARVHDLHETLAAKRQEYRGQMERISASLRAYAEELGERPNVKKLQELYAALAADYEELFEHLKELRLGGGVELVRNNHLKPMKAARNLFHMAMGIGGVVCYEFLFTRLQCVIILIGILATFAVLDVARRRWPAFNDFMIDRLFGSIVRPFERHHVPGATYFVIGLLLITPFFAKTTVQAAVLILAFADPMASIIGKRWGGFKLVHDKSAVGTLAFFLTAVLVSGLFLLTMGDVSIARALAAALVMAFSGALAELLSTRLDDNLAIPVVCTFAGAMIL